MELTQISPLFWKGVISLLLGALFILPGTKAGLLTGLPWGAFAGLVAMVGLVMVWQIPWREVRRARLVVLIGLVCLLALQIWGAAQLPYGWSVCLRRLVKVQTLQTPCEPTAEFKSGVRSYLVSDVNWPKGHLPLFFMNNNQVFNFTEESDPDRDRLPYYLSIDSFIKGGNGQSVTAKTWMSNSALVVNGDKYPLEPDKPMTVSLPGAQSYHVQFIVPHEQHAAEEYLFLKTTGQPWYIDGQLLGPNLVLMYRIAHYGLLGLVLFMLVICNRQQLLELPRSSRYGFYVLAAWLLVPFIIHDEITLLAVLLVTLLSWLWFARTKADRLAVLPALAVLGFHVLRTIGRADWLPDNTHIYEFMFLPSLFWIGWFFMTRAVGERRRLRPWLIIFLLIGSFHFIIHTHSYGSLILFIGGDDELTHEGYARQSLLATNWHAWLVSGEPYVFYYQPLYRYFLSMVHYLWGESMFGPYVLQTLIMSAVVVSTLSLMELLELPLAGLVLSMMVGTMHLGGVDSFFTLTQTAFQQALATPLLLLAIVAAAGLVVTKRASRLRWFMGVGLLWGLVISLRTDYLPMAVVVIGLCFWLAVGRRRLATMGSFLLGWFVFPALVVIRNLMVAHQFAFMPTSGLYNLISPFYGLFNGVDRRSVGTGQALITIVSQYRNHLGQLFIILGQNFVSGFIGPVLISLVVWCAVPLAVALCLWQGSRSQRLTIILFVVLALSHLLLASFFVQHNGNAMILQYAYLWFVVLAMACDTLVAYHRGRFGQPGNRAARA